MTNAEHLTPDYRFMTVALITSVEESERAQMLINETNVEEYQILQWKTMVQGIRQFSEGTTPGQKAQYLAEWYQFTSVMCSDVYALLREVSPEQTREQIREHNTLRRLNAVRLGLRYAYGVSSRDAKGTSRRSSQHK